MKSSFTRICDLSNFVDKEVILAGWLYKGRSSGKVQFLVLRDGTGLCQCVVEKSKVPGELFEQLKHLGQESSMWRLSEAR
jgi:asparaginyl-tRNA synthetase